MLSSTPDEHIKIKTLRHVINIRHTGCAKAWNTVIRLYPHHNFWIMMSDDVFFEPMQLESFYLENVRSIGSPSLGALSACMRFPNTDTVRSTFGLMAFSITRVAILRTGLFDENIFPAYYEDDDYVLRMMLAGLEFRALSNVVAFHGDESDRGYVGGTRKSSPAQAGRYSEELRRGSSEIYYRFKWGPGASSFSSH